MRRAAFACTCRGSGRARFGRSRSRIRSTRSPGCAPCTPIRVPRRWWCGTRRSAATGTAILAAIAAAEHVPTGAGAGTELPRSADVTNADVLRMVIGGIALALLGLRRYGFARPPLLGPTSRLFATGVTIVTGYPFLRGALRNLRGGRAMGTDALVSAATIASLVLRENVVALTVLWLLNIGEYLQDLTLAANPSRDLGSAAWHRRHRVGPAWPTAPRSRSPSTTSPIGDEVVVHDHVAIPVDGDRRRRRSDRRPVRDHRRDPARQRRHRARSMHAGSVVVRGRLVIRADAVGSDTTIGRIIARVEQAQLRPCAHPDHRRELLPAFRARVLPAVRGDPARHPRCAPGDDHAAGRLPVRGRTGHPDRDQRGDRQRRAPRHPDQGWLPPGAGRPGRRRRLRQDRHPDHRSAGRHQYRCLPQGLGARGRAGLRGELGDPLPASRSPKP